MVMRLIHLPASEAQDEKFPDITKVSLFNNEKVPLVGTFSRFSAKYNQLMSKMVILQLHNIPN